MDEKDIKGRIVLNKFLATLALTGALICLHFTGVSSGWQAYAFGAATGYLCAVTINRTLKASLFAFGLIMIDVAKV